MDLKIKRNIFWKAIIKAGDIIIYSYLFVAICELLKIVRLFGHLFYFIYLLIGFAI